MIDFSTNIGKLRLKVGDFQDLSILPDSVYLQTLTENENNINRSSKIIAGYIAAILSQRSHEKVSFLEIWGAEAFDNYMIFIKNIILNPSMSGTSPIPYGYNGGTVNPIITFNKNWQASYTIPNADKTLDFIANNNGV